MRYFVAIYLIAILGLYAPVASAYVGLCCGKCGGNMPMNIPGGGIPETHEWRIKISPMYMKMSGLRDGTNSVDIDSILGMPAMGKFMAAPESMDMKMLNVSAGYSFSDDWFGGIMFMYKDYSMDMKFNSAMQAMTGRSGFTMDSHGMGDTMLMAKYRLFTDDPLIPTQQASLFFGLSMPTGSIDEKNSNHPVAARKDRIMPYGMQLGSGTFDPSIGLLYQQSHSPYWWGANATYTARLYDNERDYRLGNQFRLDLYSMFQVRYDLLLQLQLNGHYQNNIKGEMDVASRGEAGHVVIGDPNSPYTTPLWDPENYGGTQAFTTIGLQWQPAELQILDLSVSLPLYRDLNGPQLETDYVVMLTWYLEVPSKSSIRHPGNKPGNSQLGF